VDDAERILVNELAAWERRYGPDHQEIAVSLYSLANIHLTGATSTARRTGDRALTFRISALGPHHHETEALSTTRHACTRLGRLSVTVIVAFHTAAVTPGAVVPGSACRSAADDHPTQEWAEDKRRGQAGLPGPAAPRDATDSAACKPTPRRPSEPDVVTDGGGRGRDLRSSISHRQVVPDGHP
jgi:hypothetical protein